MRRAKTFEEQLRRTDRKSFVLEDKVIYDNAKIKFIKPEDFVFDKTNRENGTVARKYIELMQLWTKYSVINQITF